MPIDMALVNTLERCAEIEKVMAEMYEFFAELCPDQPELARLFRKTAAEEINHEAQIRLAAKRFVPLIRDLKITAREVERHLTYVRDITAKMRQDPPDCRRALEISLHCETIFCQFHLDTAATFKDKSCSNLFEAMMAADRQHVELLQKSLAALPAT